MGIILSAITTQFISDLILPNGTTFLSGTTTELVSPDGSFTLEDIRSSVDLQTFVNSGDIILTADGDVIQNVSTAGINYISTYGGVINSDVEIVGSLSADTIYSGSTPIEQVIVNISQQNSDITRVQPGVNMNTGGTPNFPVVNLNSNIDVTNLSAGTIYSAGTDLYNIFLTTADGNDITRVQPGSNILTAGTDNLPVVRMVDSPSVDNLLISGTGVANEFIANMLSGGTIYSGSTDLETIITNLITGSTIAGGIVPLGFWNFSNFTFPPTGNGEFRLNNASITASTKLYLSRFNNNGTDLKFILDELDSANFAFSQQNDSGNRIILQVSGLTDGGTYLEYDIEGIVSEGSPVYGPPYTTFASLRAGSSNFTNTFVTGATFASDTLTLGRNDAVNVQTLINNFVSLSASTLYSGGTDVEDIIRTLTTGSEDITRVQPGTNITTGGTDNAPVVNTVDSPSFDNLSVSGTGTFDNGLSANTISAATSIYSAGTNLETIISNLANGSEDITRVQPGINTTTGGTENLPMVNITSASLDKLTVSGSNISNSFSASTISGDTIFSGSTDLSVLFDDATKVAFGTTSPPTDKLWYNTSSSTLFGFDSTRSKWISVGGPSNFGASRNNANVTNQFLRHYNGTPYNIVPAPLPFDVTLMQVTLRGQDPQTWRGFITTGTSLPGDIIINLSSGGGTYVNDDTYNIDLNEGDDIYFYCSGTSIDYPRLDLYFKRRS